MTIPGTSAREVHGDHRTEAGFFVAADQSANRRRSGGSWAFYLTGYGAANAAGSLGRQSRSGKACRAAWHQAAARLVPVSHLGVGTDDLALGTVLGLIPYRPGLLGSLDYVVPVDGPHRLCCSGAPETRRGNDWTKRFRKSPPMPQSRSMKFGFRNNELAWSSVGA
jgi:hypothetical protein